MGMIGRWIDSLTDEQRDRIIEHPDPTYHGDWWWSDPVEDGTDCGCLVGCIVGREVAASTMFAKSMLFSTRVSRVGYRFPKLTDRFSPERMWRACKARAAKRNAVILAPAESPEPASVAA